MKTRETFEDIRKLKKKRFSLNFRLNLTVSLEIVGSVLIAVGVSSLLEQLVPSSSKVPLFVKLVVLSLLVGVLATSFFTRLFFKPIKELCKAMERVADGDFKTRLETKSSLQEIRELYSGFNLMAHELDSTEILQSDFVSSVSHEIKTPISAIEGYATLLSDCDNLSEEQRKYVDKINFNTARLSSLVGNILLLSKLENQSINTQQENFRIDEQIRQSIVLLEPAWEKKNIDFDVEMDSIEYVGNEIMLRHVWNNLISNAIKFSPTDGTVKIRLTKKNGKIIFTVDDNGPGISDEAAKHIFDKFYQADSSHKEEGNGLGLSLVKRILIIVNGEVCAENLPEGGCRFTVTL